MLPSDLPAPVPPPTADPTRSAAGPAPAGLPRPGAAHRRRLREVWRSAGWPWRDPLEAELLAAGWLVRERDPHGRETVHVTDAGVAVLADTLQRNRARHDAHEALVARVAREMQRAGRVVWRGLSLRARVGVEERPAHGPSARAAWAGLGPDLWSPQGLASAASRAASPAATAAAMAAASTEPGPPPGADAGANAETGGAWVMAMPDVYSIRHTTVEAYLAPVAHEIKVQRSDLLADLRRPAKGEAYRWLAGECWYVIREGIAQPEEIPLVYGVMVAPPTGPLRVARPAPQRPMRLPFAVWMALARATPEPPDDGAQVPLTEAHPTRPAGADGRPAPPSPG